jgi:hypothetical protein
MCQTGTPPIKVENDFMLVHERLERLQGQIS